MRVVCREKEGSYHKQKSPSYLKSFLLKLSFRKLQNACHIEILEAGGFCTFVKISLLQYLRLKGRKYS